MLSADVLQSKFRAGLTHEDYVATGTPDQQNHWRSFHAQARLSDAQRRLVEGFTREMNVLVVSGIWCGDCVQQCPLLDHVAAARPERVHLRFVDRDQHPDLAAAVRICGGARVPVAVFMAEDFEFCGLAGDRSLARYRALAARQLGPSCPLPGAPVPADEIAATLADWLAEFERVQLMLRLSGRLRRRHGD